MKALIIGSGFGGLCLGIRLQARGYEVTILEKNEMIGGQASQLKKNGYTFDMGPSIITAPILIEELFSLANKKYQDYISLIPVNPFYRIAYADGSVFDYSNNVSEMKKQLSTFHPDDVDGYDQFMSVSQKLYEETFDNGLGRRPFSSWYDLLAFLPTALKNSALNSSYGFAKKYFKDERSRFAFSFHPLFLGGNPFTAPAMLQLIPYLEKHGGVWFTKGGMYSFVQALQQLFEELGGTVLLNHEVTQVCVKDGVATGVMVDEKIFHADVVISNAHSAHTYKDLLPAADRKKWTDSKIEKMDYSMSCVLLYLGVKKQYPDLPHHMIILAERYKGLVEDLFKNKIVPDNFSMYLHIPTRTDPEMAPVGSESMYVLIPVPNLKSSFDWSLEKDSFAKKVLDFLEHDFGMTDLQNSLEVKEIFTPIDFRDNRNNYLGASWSLEPKLTQMALFRPHNKSEDIKNLYLVGASTHPGAGVPGVMLSAEATEYAILEDHG